MRMRSTVPTRIAKYGYIIVSAIFCLVGLGMIIFPSPSAEAIGTFFGIAMMVFGVVKLIGYFSKDLFRLAFQYDLQFGVLFVVLGLITLIKPGNVVHFICTALGICILTDCLFKLKIAIEAKNFGIREWWLTFALAILTGFTGMVLIFHPSEVMKIVMILLGTALLTEGILNISVAISWVKIIKHQLPDVIDVEINE